METIETFSDWLKRQNFDEPLKPKIITNEDKDFIRRELKTKTVMQICKEHKYSPSTVYTIARKK